LRRSAEPPSPSSRTEKKGTKPFFDALERELSDRYGVARVVRLTKSNYSAPVEPGLLAESGRWQALIAGIGD
jgi:hypothetical protein